MYIQVILLGISKLDSSKNQAIEFYIPNVLSTWDTAWLSINHAVPRPFQLFIGCVHTEVTDSSSLALKRLLREGNKIQIEVRVRVEYNHDTKDFSLDIEKQKVIGVVKPNTYEWRAYSYKQPTKRLLKRLKGNFIKGYQLKIHTVKE